MAKLELSVHSDFREEAQPLLDALEHIADSIEDFYGSKTGCENKLDANYNAMLWGANHLAGIVSKERPSYGFDFNEDNDAELKKFIYAKPFKPDKP